MQTLLPFLVVKAQNPVKRGRGRPRKDSLASNMSQTQAYFLDEGKPLIADWAQLSQLSSTRTHLHPNDTNTRHLKLNETTLNAFF